MSSRCFTPVLFVLALAGARVATALSIVVTNDKAPVMVGSKVVATVSKGQVFVVRHLRGVWYGVHVKVGKEVIFGWIHSGNVKRATGGAKALEAAAHKEFQKRKAQADKLAAEGKFNEAIQVLDDFPRRFWKTKAAKRAVQYSAGLMKRAHQTPEFVKGEAEKEFKKRKAQADKLAAKGKVDEAVGIMKGFPRRFEDTKWAKEAEKCCLELAKHARAPFAELEKELWKLIDEEKFDDALARVRAAAKKALPGREAYLKTAEAFIELQKGAAAQRDAPVDSDPFTADVYVTDTEYRQQLSRLLNIVGPEGVRVVRIQKGKQLLTIPIPRPADQIAHGERLAAKYPWSPNLRLLLARLYARTEQMEKCLESYGQARRLDGGRSIVSLDARLEAARILTGAQRQGEAIVLLKRSLERKADDFIALAALGRAYLASDAKSKAIAAWQKSLKINPAQPRLLRQLKEAKGEKVVEKPLKKVPLPELVQQVQESCLVILAGRGSGSGYVVRADGLIATNFHVIAGGGQVQIRVKRKGNFVTIRNVQAVLLDPTRDTALLKIDARKFPLRPLRLGTAKTAVPGQDVVVIGNPGAGGKILDYTITRGIISNRDRVINGVHFFQTDAVVNPGNSGGPMFNMLGEVIGMVTLKASIERTGFALHIDHVRDHLPACFPQSE